MHVQNDRREVDPVSAISDQVGVRSSSGTQRFNSRSLHRLRVVGLGGFRLKPQLQQKNGSSGRTRINN